MGVFARLWGRGRRRKNNVVRGNTATKLESKESIPSDPPHNKPSQTFSVHYNVEVNEEDVTLWNRKGGEKTSTLGLILDESVRSESLDGKNTLLGSIQKRKSDEIPKTTLPEARSIPLIKGVDSPTPPSKPSDIISNVENNQETFMLWNQKCSEKTSPLHIDRGDNFRSDSFEEDETLLSKTKKRKTKVVQQTASTDSKSTPLIKEGIGSDYPLDNPSKLSGIQCNVEINQKDVTIKDRHDSEKRSSLVNLLVKDKDLRQDSSDKVNGISLVRLNQQGVFTWKNNDAFVYKVDSSLPSNEQNLEFVLYIPIDTAVKWFSSNNVRRGQIDGYATLQSGEDRGTKYSENERKKDGKRHYDMGGKESGKPSWNNGSEDLRIKSGGSGYDGAYKEKQSAVGNKDSRKYSPLKTTIDMEKDGRRNGMKRDFIVGHKGDIVDKGKKTVEGVDGGRKKTSGDSNKSYFERQNRTLNAHKDSERGRSTVGEIQHEEERKKSNSDEGVWKKLSSAVSMIEEAGLRLIRNSKNSDENKTSVRLTITTLRENGSLKSTAPRDDNQPTNITKSQNKPAKLKKVEQNQNKTGRKPESSKPREKKYKEEKSPSDKDRGKQNARDKRKPPQKNNTKVKENKPRKKKMRNDPVFGDNDSETSLSGPGEFYLKRPKRDVNIERMPAHRIKIGTPAPPEDRYLL